MHFRFQIAEQTYEITLERQAEGFRATVDGRSIHVEILDAQPGQLSLILEGHPVTVYWANEGSRKWVSSDGCAYLIEKPSSRSGRGKDSASTGFLRAPMPAQVRSIEVVEGDPVESGQTLLLLEAMKMEIRIKAPQPGRVTRLLVETGQTVERDQVLVEIGSKD